MKRTTTPIETAVAAIEAGCNVLDEQSLADLSLPELAEHAVRMLRLTARLEAHESLSTVAFVEGIKARLPQRFAA